MSFVENREPHFKGRLTVGADDEQLLFAVVRNNAEWCETVCRARGAPGRFSEHLWVNERATPPYYPNIITLTPYTEARSRELCQAVERGRAATGDDSSVKDSFADADLVPFGLRVLFDARWICRDASLAVPAPSLPGVAWSMVTRPADLDAWKQGWDGEILKVDPVFVPALLRDENVAFVAGHRDGDLVAGAIANRHAGVVGVSNVFAPPSEALDFWAGCVAAAMAWAPGLPVAGYESGADLARALSLGFRALGSLRVWVSTSAS